MPSNFGRTTSVTPCPAAYVTRSGTDAITVSVESGFSSGSRNSGGERPAWDGDLEPPPDVKDVVEEAEEGGGEEAEQAGEVGRKRVMWEEDRAVELGREWHGRGAVERGRDVGHEVGEVRQWGEEGQEKDVDRRCDHSGRFWPVCGCGCGWGWG